jgi:hypothetical protein
MPTIIVGDFRDPLIDYFNYSVQMETIALGYTPCPMLAETITASSEPPYTSHLSHQAEWKCSKIRVTEKARLDIHTTN